MILIHSKISRTTVLRHNSFINAWSTLPVLLVLNYIVSWSYLLIHLSISSASYWALKFKYKIFVYFLAPATVSGIQKMLDKNSEPKIYSTPLQDSVQLRVPRDTQHWYSEGVQSFYSKGWHVPHMCPKHTYWQERESARMQRNWMSHTLLMGKMALLLNQTYTNYVIQQSYSWVFTREIKTYLHIKTCTQMFIAPLFVIIKS